MIPKLKVGVAGLGRAFSLMLPAWRADPRIELAAGADPRPQARAQFEREFGAKAFESVEALCAEPAVQVVYIATPHQFHASHAVTAARSGKHVLVEKPMALSLQDCRTMIAAARESRVQIVVGHSHSFDAPIAHARKIIASGELGPVRMVSALNYTDFLYRPRRPEELDTGAGGGVVFNQAAHQVDVVRLLVGSRVTSVKALTGAWDPARPTEGAYSCQLRFDGGAFASLIYSGYAHFDSDEFTGWIAEMGVKKDPSKYASARDALRADELAAKNEGIYGGSSYREPPTAEAHSHFGLVLVSCQHGDVRPLPSGVMIYGDRERRFESLPAPTVSRLEVIDELYDAVVNGKPPLHSGEWAMATMEVCLAMLRSAREQRDLEL